MTDAWGVFGHGDYPYFTSVPVQAPLLATASADWLPRHSQRGKNRTTQPAAQYAQYYSFSGQWVLSAALARRPLSLSHFFAPPCPAAPPKGRPFQEPSAAFLFCAFFSRCPQTSSLTSFSQPDPFTILVHRRNPANNDACLVVLRSRRDAPRQARAATPLQQRCRG